MKLSDLDFGGGKACSLLHNIDFDLSLEEQKWDLVEDICQMIYENGYLIDVGWYPIDMNITEDSEFRVYIIKNVNWEQPQMIYRSKTLAELKSQILEAIKRVNNLGKFR